MLFVSPLLFVLVNWSVDFRKQGGIGVIGGIRMSPKILQDAIDELKSHLETKDAPFGVDLALPQVGGGARKTNVRAFHLTLVDYFTFKCAVRLY